MGRLVLCPGSFRPIARLSGAGMLVMAVELQGPWLEAGLNALAVPEEKVTDESLGLPQAHRSGQD